MKRPFFLPLLLCCLSVILTVWINLCIAERYLHSYGKTRALFGITELTYDFQYGVAILGITALVLSVLSKTRSRLRLLCIAISLLSIIIVFISLWRLFV